MTRTYFYQTNFPDIPPIPILTVQLFLLQIPCPVILDTGADCSLLPLKLLMQAKARPTQGVRRIPVCGIEALSSSSRNWLSV